MRLIITHGIGDLARDLSKKPAMARKGFESAVKRNAQAGNAKAKAFASEQHTMFGDEDVTYPPSFTAEARTGLRWEYGPDQSIGDGSQAEGYEHGSINSPPHNDLGRSLDLQAPLLAKDAGDVVDRLFW